MLIAENDLEEKCYIYKLTLEEIKKAKKKKWFCPGCHSQVIIKSGKVNRSHLLIKPVRLVICSRKMNQKNT